MLGIEGGGTKTEWLLAAVPGDEIVRQGSLPAANLKLITDSALARIFQALPQEATHVGAFLAGCATEADRARLRAVVRQTWPLAEITVGSDRDSGFAAAFGDGDGIAVISGTGSAVTGRKGSRIEKAGGWGQLLGDKGGGYNIAVHGLRHTLSAYDLSRKTSLLGEKILHALSLSRLQDLVNWAANADKMSVAKLAPVMFAAAEEGDEEMRMLIESGAHILADYTAAVAQRLELASPEVKLLGGLFANHAIYVDFFKGRLDKILPGARVALCHKSGAIGAAWLAARKKSGAPSFKSAPVSYDELAELRTAITEQPHPGSSHLDRLTVAEIVDLFVAEEKNVPAAVAACRGKICAAVELVDASLQNGGRLFYIGAGTSGRMGVLDASEIPPTFGASPELVQGIIAGGFDALFKAVEGAEDQADDGKFSIIERGVRLGDAVCGITASGRTPFVLGALHEARKIGAKTVLLTCNPARHRSGAAWDVEIDLPTGPEIITGSTRLKAGSATKLALNILSTCAMIRLGKVNGNLMSNLHATNVKLRDRAVRLVSNARGLTYSQALDLLEKSDWQVRDCLQ